MEKEVIHILCCTDENYAPYCGIMLTSLFMNNKGEDISVNIMIDSNLSAISKKKFKKLSDDYGQTIRYVQVKTNIFDKYPTKGLEQWVTNVYYRLLASDLLNDEVRKVLYLDCDMIITSSIRELWETSLENIAVAGAFDPGTYNPEFYQRLGLDTKTDYINGGMLLLNLDYWRKNNIVSQCLDYLEKNHSKLLCNDQDIVNVVLQHQKKTIDSKYNYMTYTIRNWVLETLPKVVRQKVLSIKPVIIHYAGVDKPWQITYYHKPFYQEWKYYKKHSYWRFKLPSFPKRKIINKLLKRFIFLPLGFWEDRDNDIIA